MRRASVDRPKATAVGRSVREKDLDFIQTLEVERDRSFLTVDFEAQVIVAARL